MSVEVPRKVGFYCLTSAGMLKVAVFQWTDSEGVRLDVLDASLEIKAGLARRRYSEGVYLNRVGRVVTPDEPSNFMEALVDPLNLTNMSYYNFRRED